jgi:hypothetical protein
MFYSLREAQTASGGAAFGGVVIRGLLLCDRSPAAKIRIAEDSPSNQTSVRAGWIVKTRLSLIQLSLPGSSISPAPPLLRDHNSLLKLSGNFSAPFEPWGASLPPGPVTFGIVLRKLKRHEAIEIRMRRLVQRHIQAPY